MITASSVYQLE